MLSIFKLFAETSPVEKRGLTHSKEKVGGIFSFEHHYFCLSVMLYKSSIISSAIVARELTDIRSPKHRNRVLEKHYNLFERKQSFLIQKQRGKWKK